MPCRWSTIPIITIMGIVEKSAILCKTLLSKDYAVFGSGNKVFHVLNCEDCLNYNNEFHISLASSRHQ